MKIRQLRATMIAAGIMGIVIVGLIASIINQQVTVSRLSSDISEQKQSLSRLSKETAESKVLTKKYQSLSSKVGVRYKSVSWGTQLPFMVNQITGIMQAEGLKVQNLRPDPITSADGVSRLPLRITFNAGLENLAKLVHSIETSVPYLNVERMDIHIADDKSGSLQTDMTIASFAITDQHAPEYFVPKSPDRKNKAARKTAGGRKLAKISKATGGSR